MGRLIVIGVYLSLLTIADCECRNNEASISNYGTNPYYHSSPKYVQDPSIYKNPSNSALIYDSTKTSPLVVTYPQISNYPLNQQYHTLPQHGPVEFSLQTGTVQAPFSVSQGLFPTQVSQYKVNHPFPQQNLYIPFNQFEQVATNLNQNYQRHPPQSANPTQQIQRPKIGTVVGAAKPVQLFQHQVFHPLHTKVETQEIIPQKQKLLPPTPPKIYRNFHPVVHPPISVTQKPIPVKEQEQPTKEEEEEEEKEEINEEEEEEEEAGEKLENIEDENPHFNKEESNDDEDEDYFRPGKYVKHHFEDDHTQEADEDDSESHSESRPSTSKLSSKFKYPKNKFYNNKQMKAFSAGPYFGNFKEFPEPKMEFRMYKYSKKMQKPERKEYIEGKESENIPIIHRRQKSYQEQWIISTKSSSLSQ